MAKTKNTIVNAEGEIYRARALVDQFGNHQGIFKNPLHTNDFAIPFSAGLVTGYRILHKFGHTPTLGTSQEDIWDNGGMYVYPSAAAQMTVSSSSANDTAAGTGARTVEVFGLDANYLEVNELITLNGQTPVTTTNSYLRIYRMVIRSAGSSGWNEGDIYIGSGAVTGGVPATIYGRITFDTVYGKGENQTLMAIYTIPAGKTGFVKKLHFAVNRSSKPLELWAYARPIGEVFQVKYRSMIDIGNLTIDFNGSIPESGLAEKTDFALRASVETGTVDVAGGFELILVDNTLLV